VFAVALAAILVIPTLAASVRLDSLLDFSNPGTSVDESEFDLRGLNAVDRAGVEGDTVKLLGEGGRGRRVRYTLDLFHASSIASSVLCVRRGDPIRASSCALVTLLQTDEKVARRIRSALEA
jgi:hypothetical protein